MIASVKLTNRLASFALVAITLGACTSVGHPATDTPPPPTPSPSPAAVGGETPTADGTIAAVSASNPSAEAADAMARCQVGESIPLTMVAAMGRVPSARDVPRYVPLTGKEPEIQTDAPAWVIQLSGDIPMPQSGEVWRDPVCVVVAGGSGYYATGPVTNTATGEVMTPTGPAVPPDLKLPPLAP